MGRRSGGGGGGGFRSAPRASAPAPKPATKPAAKQSSAPAPAKTDSNAPTSIIGSIGSAVADGIGWGVGTTMAHRAMDSILGPRTIKVIEEPAPAAAPADDACGIQNQAFSNEPRIPWIGPGCHVPAFLVVTGNPLLPARLRICLFSPCTARIQPLQA